MRLMTPAEQADYDMGLLEDPEFENPPKKKKQSPLAAPQPGKVNVYLMNWDGKSLYLCFHPGSSCRPTWCCCWGAVVVEEFRRQCL